MPRLTKNQIEKNISHAQYAHINNMRGRMYQAKENKPFIYFSLIFQTLFLAAICIFLIHIL